jgi:uncharacterized caspase-like protein
MTKNGIAAPAFCIRAFICTRLLICFSLLYASIENVQAQEPDASKFNQTYENAMSKARAECDALWSDPVFDPIRDKFQLGDDKPTHQMLTNPERVRPEDKPLADLAIKTNGKCREAYAPAFAMLPPQVNAMIGGAHRRQDALIAELYVGKITIGEYNVGMNQVSGEILAALSGIPQSRSSSQPESSSTGPLSAVQQQAPPVPPQPVVHQVRRALVIGNSSYSSLSKLANAANDANAIADKLRGIDFRTTLVLDASEQDLRREVRRFASESASADIALVFYAGHGAQVNGENYLLPVDMEIARTEADIQLTGLKVDDLVNSIRSTTKIVFLDACRNNPALFKSLVKGRGAPAAIGLAPTQASNLNEPKPGGGVFIAYATDSGSVAEDGESNHSPFTEALLRNLTKPISIDDMFSLVTREVRLITKSKQRPYKYASLESVVCLTGICSTAPIRSGMEEAASQANRSIEEELQIALRTKSPDALQAYLEKYPDTPKLLEISEQIASLRRAEFNEWTLYQTSTDGKFPQYLQISSIKPFGDKVAVRNKLAVDPSWGPLFPGKEFPDGVFNDTVLVFDCKRLIMATAESTIVSKSGETLFHYKWGNPEFLDLWVPIPPGSIASTAANIVCHKDFRTPLVSKKRLTSMNFLSVSSTASGDGETFYELMQHNSATQDKQELLLLVKFQTDHELEFPNLSVPGPKYLTQVHRVQLSCTENKWRFLKLEDYDASNNFVYLSVDLAATNPSMEIPWIEFDLTSSAGLLQRMVCPTIEFGGLGIEVAKEDNLIKVVTVIDGTPAAEAGVKAKDIITHLNDESADALDLNQAIEKIRGPANTKIKLKIKREGQESPIELSITRAIIKARSKEVQK